MTFKTLCSRQPSLLVAGMIFGILVQTAGLAAQPLPGPLSGVWVYPSDANAAPQAFSAPDWLLSAQPDAVGVLLTGEQGRYNLNVDDYRLILVNQGDGALAPLDPGPLLGPVFSLSGLTVAEPSELGAAVNIQIGPNLTQAKQTLKVQVQATRPQSESAAIELKVRVLCSQTPVTEPVSSDPADFGNNAGCSAKESERSGRSLAAHDVVLTHNQYYRIDAMARVVGASYGSVVSKRYQISGAADLATRDGDGDGIPDLVELDLGLDFQNGDFSHDADGDGWSELDEWIRCDQPDRSQCADVPLDSDFDGWSDYDEVEFRWTDPNDTINVTDANGQPQTIAKPYGSEPTAERLYEVEYRVSGRLFEQRGQQIPSSDLTDLSVLDIYGRNRFDQRSLPRYAAPSLAKADVPLETDLAVWNQASRYADPAALPAGILPSFQTVESGQQVTRPVLRFAAGQPSFIRLQQKAQAHPEHRTSLVFVRWLDAAPDPSPERSACSADPSAPEGAGQAWLACYRAYLKQTLVRDLPNLNFGPEDAVDVAMLGGLLAWVSPEADPATYFLPGSRQRAPDPDAVSRLRRLMPESLGHEAFSTLRQRLNQLSQPLGVLDSLARSIESVVEDYKFYLTSAPAPNTTQSHAADVLRNASDDELYALRLAVVSDQADFAAANFDSQSDQDGDGIKGFDELANSRQVTQPAVADTDGDGLNDEQDPCPRSADQSCLTASSGDRDGDGVADGLDNCPEHSNPGQEDSKSHPQFNAGQGNDGVGDACADTALAFIIKPGDDLKVLAGQSVNFLARVTERVDNDIAMVNLSWDFGDDVAKSEDADPVRQFTKAGVRTVQLIAEYAGITSQDEVQIEVMGDVEQAAVVSVSDLSVSEADGVVQLPVTLSLPLDVPVAIAVVSSAGTAQSPADFQAINEKVEFAPGQQIAVLNLSIVDDADIETLESFFVDLSLESGPAMIARPRAEVRISDNDVQGNRDPVAVNDSVDLLEDASAVDIDVLANDTDADADTLTLTALGAPSDPAAGVFSIVANKLHFEPAADYFGSSITVSYSISDGAGGSASGQLSLNIAPVNDPPTFVMGSDLTVSNDNGAVVQTAWVSNLRVGPDNELDQSVISRQMTVTNTPLFDVQPSINNNGDLSFTPAANASGTSTVSYWVKDNGGTSDGGHDISATKSATITIVPFERAITDPSVLDGQRGFGFYSTTERLRLGSFVSSAPDMNADGCDEILIGANNESNSNPLGLESSYLIFGADNDGDAAAGCAFNLPASAQTDIDSLPATGAAYRFVGMSSWDFGVMLMSAGDVSKDADGTPDLLLANPNNEYESASTPSPGYVVLIKGEALVDADTFGGTPADGQIDINALVAAPDLRAVGYLFENATLDQKRLGQSVAGIGDVNGDGSDDFAILSVDNSGPSEARVHVIFGGAVNLANLDNDDGNLDGRIEIGSAFGPNGRGLIINTSAPGNGNRFATRYYPFVAAAGDLNDDGIDDFAVSLPGAEIQTNSGAGQIAVVYGDSSLTTQGALSVDDLTGTQGFHIDGRAASRLLGRSLATAGDFNEDGVVDLAFNSYDESNWAEVAVLYGGSHLESWPTVSDGINVADFDASTGFRIRTQGLTNAAFGLAFHGLDGPGSDLLIPSGGDNTRGGYMDLLWGGLSQLELFDRAFTLAGETEPGGRSSFSAFDGKFGQRLRAEKPNIDIGNFPHGIAAQFDFNGDGLADTLVGEPDYDQVLRDEGRAYLLLAE